MTWFHWFSLLTTVAAIPVLIPWAREAMPPLHHQPEQQPLTVLRVVDLDGRIVSTVKHEDPLSAWALADDAIARTPNPSRALIEPVRT